MFEELFNDIELDKKNYKKDLKISLNEMNKKLEKNNVTVSEYAVISGDSVKYTGKDLLQAYREYNNWNREQKSIVYATIKKGYFMEEEWIIDLKTLKYIK